jgi:large subunit ribosomal protein L32
MGAIAQQRRVSKTRKLKRRTHYKLEVPGMVVCPNCGELKLSHRVCPVCGHYNGKQVKEIKVKEEKNDKEILVHNLKTHRRMRFSFNRTRGKNEN